MGWVQRKDEAPCPYCLPMFIAAIGFGLYALILLFAF